MKNFLVVLNLILAQLIAATAMGQPLPDGWQSFNFGQSDNSYGLHYEGSDRSTEAIQDLIDATNQAILTKAQPDLNWIYSSPVGSVVGYGYVIDQKILFSYCPEHLANSLICNDVPVPVVQTCPAPAQSPPCNLGSGKVSSRCDSLPTEIERTLCMFKKGQGQAKSGDRIIFEWDGQNVGIADYETVVIAAPATPSTRYFDDVVLGTKQTVPSVVALVNNDNEVKCSGTIVSDRFILSAAHCLCDGGADLSRAWIGQPVGQTLNSAKDGVSWGIDLVPQANGGVRIFPADDADGEFCSLPPEKRRNLPDLALVEYVLSDGVGPMAGDYVTLPSLSALPDVSGEFWYVGYGTGSEMQVADEYFRRKGAAVGWGGKCGLQAGKSNCATGVDVALDRILGRKQNVCPGDSGGPLFRQDKLVGVIRQIAGDGDAICDDGSVFTAFDGNERDAILAWFTAAGVEVRKD